MVDAFGYDDRGNAKDPERFEYRKEVFLDGELLPEFTVSGQGLDRGAHRITQAEGVVPRLERSGRYEIRYTVIDERNGGKICH